MKLVAITGGIASGKSTILRSLSARLHAPWVSCDQIVDALYAEEEVLMAVRQRFGNAVFPQGALDRKALGKTVFADEEARRWLEGLLHPLVLQAIQTWREKANAERHSAWGFVEVPLLYEVDFPLDRDIDMVVACSRSTQLERIRRRDHLGEEQAQGRISAQLPIEHKVIRADVVVWNDGSEAVLEQLIDLAAEGIEGIRS